MVGDVVLAIGNPFGLKATVTMGIVSAAGARQLKMSTSMKILYRPMPAIKPGQFRWRHLVNAYGELVGVNSDIYSPSGGSIGIGFAIPVSTAKAVLDQIVAHGRVIRASCRSAPNTLIRLRCRHRARRARRLRGWRLRQGPGRAGRPAAG